MKVPFIGAEGIRFIRNQLTRLPRPDKAATDAVRQWAKSRGVELDPDRVDAVTLHYQFHASHWYATVVQRLTLTEALLSNWQGESANNLVGALFGAPWAGDPPPDAALLVDALPYRASSLALSSASDHAVYNGLYRQHMPPIYDQRTHVALPAEDFQSFVWNLDLHVPYRQMLDEYWASHLDDHALALKLCFIAACNAQVQEGSLSRAGQRLAWAFAGLSRVPVSARMLNIYGYVSSDILWLTTPDSATTLLYIPGNASPFHEFADASALCSWVAHRCREEAIRTALLRHFPPADTPDGLSYSGLETVLIGLGLYPAPHRFSTQHPGFATSGIWSPQTYVGYEADTYSPPLEGEPFLELALRMRERSYQDADFIITADATVTKGNWRQYLRSALDLLTPLAIVLPQLAPLLALGGIAQFGLGLDQAINGKTLDEKVDGVKQATFGLLNAAPLVHDATIGRGAVFRGLRRGFVMPSQLGGQPGYALYPLDSTALEETERYFSAPEPVAPRQPADPSLAGAVFRIPRYNGTQDMLIGSIGGHREQIVYDLERDAFVKREDLHEEVDPPRYFFPSTPGTIDLKPASGVQRTVDDASRMRSLNALGIDLRLPVDLTTLVPQGVLEDIPHQVSSLWVGDKVLDEKLLLVLEKNARILDEAGFRYRLYLSRTTESAYASNLEALDTRVPALEVMTLEDQPFYRAFADSEYFAQYEAAIDGNGGVATNYASASDILRYRLLHHEGGIYMDVDDRLLAPGEYPARLGGVNYGEPAERITDIELKTSAEGLLLNRPTSNQSLKMDVLYNTSMIGSHAGNPTLEAVSREIHARYRSAPDFYRARPHAEEDPDGFERYCAELSRLTGPGVFNDVVDRLRPELYLRRQLCNLAMCPALGVRSFVDMDTYPALAEKLTPFGRFAVMGNAHSWMDT